MRKKSGFTIIELTVVIAVLLVLAGISVPVVSSITHGARVDKTRLLLDKISLSMTALRGECDDMGYFDCSAEELVRVLTGQANVSTIAPGFDCRKRFLALNESEKKDVGGGFTVVSPFGTSLNYRLEDQGPARVEVIYFYETEPSSGEPIELKVHQSTVKFGDS